MRILCVSNLFPPHVVGGYELGCLMNAEAARRAGHEVQVATSVHFGMLDKKPFRHGLEVRQIFAPVYDYEFGARSYQRPADYASAGGVHVGNAAALAATLEAWRPDVIWMFNPLGIGPVGILETAAASGVPTVVHLMDALDEGIRLSQHGFELSARWAAAKRRVHAIACSQATLQRNSAIGTYRTATVIPCGIPRDDVPPVDERPALPAGGKVRAVYFGQLKAHKGTRGVVAAIGILRSQMGLDVELHLVGGCEAEFAAELRRVAAAGGCADAIHWHGTKDRRELHAVLGTMHLAILPLNAQEAFGYVAVEAALHGMCVAVGEEAGSVEIFPRDYPYLLGRRDDPAEIARTVQRIIRDHDERRHWEALLPGHVRGQCDLEGVCLPRYLSVLRLAIADGAAAAAADDALARTLAAWQMNRNLARLTGDEGPAPADKSRRLGRRIERAVRRVVPMAVLAKFRPLARQFRRRSA